MTKPASTTKKPRKQHTPEFRQEAVIVHTDRGGQYCSADYQAHLKRHNLRGSMSAKGCCYDNACAKSFFHSAPTRKFAASP